MHVCSMNLLICKFLNTCTLHCLQQAKLQTAFWFILNLPSASFICSCTVKLHNPVHIHCAMPDLIDLSHTMCIFFQNTVFCLISPFVLCKICHNVFCLSLYVSISTRASKPSEVWESALYAIFKYMQEENVAQFSISCLKTLCLFNW